MADISAQIIINYRLEEALKHVVIIGEEDSTDISPSLQKQIQKIFADFGVAPEIKVDSPDSIRRILMSNKLEEDGDEYFWTVDPIDGTKGFIRGDQYSVCIAMISKSTLLPIISALACPNLPFSADEMGLLMVSIASVGNFVCKLGEDSGKLEKLPKFGLQTDLSEAIFTGAVVSNHTNPLEINAIKANFNNQVPIIQMDSQCKYGLLALNRAHVYYRRHTSKDAPGRRSWDCDYIEAIWDNAPGYLFVKEAGGQVTDFDGNDLRFPPKKHFRIVGGILASMLTPELHQEVIRVVKERNPKVQE